MIEIRNRYTNELMHAVEVETLISAVEILAGKTANLREADLYGADLYGANLREADLYGADLRGADLREADLREANLRGANLRGANLRGANLRGADLRGADLYGADLRGADLREANLRGANLRGANLRGADLRGADLYGADLRGAKNAELAWAACSIVPAGSLIVWKKCSHNVIVKLRIPEDARRSNATGRKCRAEFADVLEVIGGSVGVSQHDGRTEYHVGQRVTCDTWCDDRWQECGGGIHFYLTREEAEAH